jgi:hypothetical protein
MWVYQVAAMTRTWTAIEASKGSRNDINVDGDVGLSAGGTDVDSERDNEDDDLVRKGVGVDVEETVVGVYESPSAVAAARRAEAT